MQLLPMLIFAATEGAEEVISKDPGIYGLLIPLIPLLPILGFAFTALFGRRLQLRFGRTAAAIVPLATVVVVWVVALMVIWPAFNHVAPFGEEGLDVPLWTWIPAGALPV